MTTTKPAICRFAPSITGSAHPGTLLAALLCWLDARSQGAQIILRLEDLDTTRLRIGQQQQMCEALEWLGLDWDEVQTQSHFSQRHEAAIDQLEALGVLYACTCSRNQWQSRSSVYDNHCRAHVLSKGQWRTCTESIRVCLKEVTVVLADGSGLDLGQTPSVTMGDPIVKRRDGIIAYQLASVVDDAASQVTRVMRGRDLAQSTATQFLLQTYLSAPHPHYHHHVLLMEQHGTKLAKQRASQPFTQLKQQISGPALCGQLAYLVGLVPDASPCLARDLPSVFSWDNVVQEDILYRVKEKST